MIEKQRLTINIDSELKIQIKMLSLKKGKSLGDMLEPKIKEFVEENQADLE